MSVTLTPSADKNWITACWACFEESMARSLTVISLLLQSTTHCRYRVYTKFLLTYTAIYRGNRKVLPLGITALQPQSHFHLGTPYNNINSPFTWMVTYYILHTSHTEQSLHSWINHKILSVFHNLIFILNNTLLKLSILHPCIGSHTFVISRCIHSL